MGPTFSQKTLNLILVIRKKSPFLNNIALSSGDILSYLSFLVLDAGEKLDNFANYHGSFATIIFDAATLIACFSNKVRGLHTAPRHRHVSPLQTFQGEAGFVWFLEPPRDA